MNVRSDDDFSALIKFIIEEIPWAVKKELDRQTDIVNDLGLYGDDCIEFMKNFCIKFDIECNKLNFSLCGQEGIDPIAGLLLGVLSAFKKKEKAVVGLKISDLIELIEKNRNHKDYKVT